jgi:uncharacterized Zn finger protein
MVEVIIRDSRGSCPKCSGMLKTDIPMVSYRCIDCGKVFFAVSGGYAENGVIIKEMND